MKTGADSVPHWHGVYLGIVTQTRTSDLWVRVQVPQITSNAITNWARPMGFNSISAAIPPPANIKNDGAGTDENQQALGWGGWLPLETHGKARALGYTEQEVGPGPPAGSLVMVMFVGGDINHPAYLLTSQKT